MSEQESDRIITSQQVQQLRGSTIQVAALGEGGLTNAQSSETARTKYPMRQYLPENRVRFGQASPTITQADELWWYQGENPFCVAMALFQLLHQHGVYPSVALRDRLVAEAKSRTTAQGTAKVEGIYFNELGKIYQTFAEAREIPLDEIREGKDFFSTAGTDTLNSRIEQKRYEKVKANLFAFQRILKSGKFAILNVNPWAYKSHPTENSFGYHAVTLRNCWVDDEGYPYAEIVDPARGIFTLPLEMLTDALIPNEVAYVG